MTDQTRKEIAMEFRAMLNKRVERKQALKTIERLRNVDRSTVYRWCKKFNISTN